MERWESIRGKGGGRAGRRGRQMEEAGEGGEGGGEHEPRGILSAVIQLSLSGSPALARHTATRTCGSFPEERAAIPPSR